MIIPFYLTGRSESGSRLNYKSRISGRSYARSVSGFISFWVSYSGFDPKVLFNSTYYSWSGIKSNHISKSGSKSK